MFRLPRSTHAQTPTKPSFLMTTSKESVNVVVNCLDPRWVRHGLVYFRALPLRVVCTASMHHADQAACMTALADFCAVVPVFLR